MEKTENLGQMVNLSFFGFTFHLLRGQERSSQLGLDKRAKGQSKRTAD